MSCLELDASDGGGETAHRKRMATNSAERRKKEGKLWQVGIYDSHEWGKTGLRVMMSSLRLTVMMSLRLTIVSLRLICRLTDRLFFFLTPQECLRSANISFQQHLGT